MSAQRIEQLAEGIALWPGDCRTVLPEIDANSIDAGVTDPPYGLGFMGKGWDHGVPDVAHWRAIFRVLKPGAHLAAFGGTRTFGRLWVVIEEAGFEIRDTIMWVYGSGFPKSLDVSKAIDKARRRDFVRVAVEMGVSLPARSLDDWTQEDHAPGDKWWTVFKESLPPDLWAKIERRVIGETVSGESAWFTPGAGKLTAPATDAARQWSGYGTALKPAVEPIILARKPLSESTVAANVLKWGTGALNIDGCRVGVEGGGQNGTNGSTNRDNWRHGSIPKLETPIGRWPANVIHDGSDEVVEAFPDGGGGSFAQSGERALRDNPVYGKPNTTRNAPDCYGDSGSAARFFYTAKADADDRLGSKHPTVKPLDLMQYLVRLVTPKSGTVLDPFAGTGTTGEASFREGMRAVLIEREEEYCADIRRRMALVMSGPEERKREGTKARNADKPADHGPLFA